MVTTTSKTVQGHKSDPKIDRQTAPNDPVTAKEIAAEDSRAAAGKGAAANDEAAAKAKSATDAKDAADKAADEKAKAADVAKTAADAKELNADKEAKDAADKAKATPKAKMTKVTIKGKGTMPLLGDGAMRRVECGKPIEVSEAELAYIERNGVALG